MLLEVLIFIYFLFMGGVDYSFEAALLESRMTNNDFQKWSHRFFFSTMYNNVYTKNPLLIVGLGATFGQKPNPSVLNQEMFRRVSAALQLESTASVQQQSTLQSAAQIHLGLHSLPRGCREAPTIHTCSPTTGALSRRGATAACRL